MPFIFHLCNGKRDTVDRLLILTCDVRRVPAGFYRAEGMIKNVNTIEEFRQLCTERTAFLQQAGRTVSLECIYNLYIHSSFFSC